LNWALSVAATAGKRQLRSRRGRRSGASSTSVSSRCQSALSQPSGARQPAIEGWLDAARGSTGAARRARL